ncbi:MAG TPA: hypothetical protein VGU71_06500 [Candidatus Dormibacteraeota bacterium]|nr:hypothetical protein [Candidatus Dormibacteraeota bacterium]
MLPPAIEVGEDEHIQIGGRGRDVPGENFSSQTEAADSRVGLAATPVDTRHLLPGLTRRHQGHSLDGPGDRGIAEVDRIHVVDGT